jgi:glycosyltransferase involved in cell wall biosynthesis
MDFGYSAPSVTFVSDRRDDNRGSYRIWVRDALAAFAEIGVTTRIIASSDIGRLAAFDGIVMLDKGLVDKLSLPEDRRYLVGAINPGLRPSAADFAIVGSFEEQISLSAHYRQCFFWPLIERQFETVAPRKHLDRDTLTICYHGGGGHLGTMASSGLMAALEAFEHELARSGRRLSFKVITGTERPRWVLGQPKVPTTFIKYDAASVGNEILAADLGVAPNAYFTKADRMVTAAAKRLFNLDRSPDDFVMRFKPKSNYGRALVFQQLGIPVIADMTPSHFDLIEHGETGFLAGNEASWLAALNALAAAPLRTRIAEAAWQKTRERFLSHIVARRFLGFAEQVRPYRASPRSAPVVPQLAT